MNMGKRVDIQIGSAQLAAERSGSGDSLIFLHAGVGDRRMWPPPSAYDRVAELNLPVSVVWGDLDFPHVAANCRYLVQTIPGAQGVEIRGSAHLPNLEQPETINKLIRSFLKRKRSH